MQYTNLGFALGFFLLPLFMPIVVSSDDLIPDMPGIIPERTTGTKVELPMTAPNPSDPNHLSQYWILSEYIGNIDTFERQSRETFRGYRRINTKNLLEHETRKKIYDLVCKNPGINLSRLAELSECNESTLRYHLDQISHENYITRMIMGDLPIFLKNGSAFPLKSNSSSQVCHQASQVKFYS
jgi:hypothetical protein